MFSRRPYPRMNRGRQAGLPPGPEGGYEAWWRADDLSAVGDGNPITTWVDRTGNYTLTKSGAGSLIWNESDATANNQPSVTQSGSAIATVSIDLSGTDQVHVFVAGYGGGGASTRVCVEHTDSSASVNGFGLFALSGTVNMGRHFGDVGDSQQRLTVADTAVNQILELNSDKGRAAAEAKLFVDGIPFDTQAADSNNTNNFTSDTLNVFARSGISLEWGGGIEEIVLYTTASLAGRPGTLAYLKSRYGIA